MRKGYNHLKYFEGGAVTKEEDTTNVWWRSQTKAVYNVTIWGTILTEIRP